jgi:hypothetical protein
MSLWSRFAAWLLPLDPEPGIGYGCLKLPDDSPFMRAAIEHDRQYEDLAAGTCPYTLEEVDRIFHLNCERAAMAFTDPGDRALYWRQAQLLYLTVRAWGRMFRGELASFQPKVKS